MSPIGIAVSVAVLAGCASESGGPATGPEPQAKDHGAELARVRVPERDGSPPAVRVALATPGEARAVVEASQPPGRAPATEVELAAPLLRGTTLGEDRNGGVARVRVSISERIVCRGVSGRHFERLRRRYFPPPQIERIRAAPGARLPTLRTRSLQLSLIGARCGPDADAVEVQGQLWGEAINGHGLEAVTPHIHFSFRPSQDGTSEPQRQG